MNNKPIIREKIFSIISILLIVEVTALLYWVPQLLMFIVASVLVTSLLFLTIEILQKRRSTYISEKEVPTNNYYYLQRQQSAAKV